MASTENKVTLSRPLQHKVDPVANFAKELDLRNRIGRQRFLELRGNYADARVVRDADGSVWTEYTTPTRVAPRTPTQVDRGEPASTIGGNLMRTRVDSEPPRTMATSSAGRALDAAWHASEHWFAEFLEPTKKEKQK
jgi:hypothetical protein